MYGKAKVPFELVGLIQNPSTNSALMAVVKTEGSSSSIGKDFSCQCDCLLSSPASGIALPLEKIYLGSVSS